MSLFWIIIIVLLVLVLTGGIGYRRRDWPRKDCAKEQQTHIVTDRNSFRLS